jgi:Ca2+-binding EF-hand superfamily protein
MEFPLIGLGLADNRIQVEIMYKEMDLDENGEIDFDEFLQLVKKSEKKEYNHKLRQFFEICKNLDFDKDSLNFNNTILSKQRKLVMDAFLAVDYDKRMKGRIVLNNVSKVIKE